MDFKGITWVENIYQRFEAMCLEVEEAMYEDTVKYMESQAHKVGGSVKKFYSEMMEDLLSSSCINPEQNAYGDYLLNSYGHVDVSKKLRLSISDAYGQLKKNEIEDISDSAEGVLRKDGSLCSPPPIVFVESIYSDGCSATSKKSGAYRRPVGVKRVSRSSLPPKPYVPENDRICNGDEAEKITAPISDASFETTDSRKIPSTEIPRKQLGIAECVSGASERIIPTTTPTHKKADDSECMTSSHSLVEQPNASGVAIETHENRVNSLGTMFNTSTEDEPKDDGSWFKADPDARIGRCNSEPEAEELIFPHEEVEIETLMALEMSQLDETCVLVEAIDTSTALDTAPQGTDKPKTYKKKIREALASKLRLKKKQHQMVEEVTGKSPCGTSESDWELL